jgi:hypothetical protein
MECLWSSLRQKVHSRPSDNHHLCLGRLGSQLGTIEIRSFDQIVTSRPFSLIHPDGSIDGPNEFDAGGSSRSLLRASLWSPTEYKIKVSGYPSIKVRLFAWSKICLYVPQSFSRPVPLVQPTADFLRVLGENTVHLIVDGGDKKWEDPKYDGYAFWLTCEDDLRISSEKLLEMRSESGNNQRFESKRFTPRRRGLHCEELPGPKFKLITRKDDGKPFTVVQDFEFSKANAGKDLYRWCHLSTSTKIREMSLSICALLFALLLIAPGSVLAQDLVPLYTSFAFASNDAMGACTEKNEGDIQLSLNDFLRKTPSLALWNFVTSKPEAPEVSYTRLKVTLERSISWQLKVRLLTVGSNTPIKEWTVQFSNQNLDDRTSPSCRTWPALIQEAIRADLLERRKDDFEAELKTSAPLAKGLKPFGSTAPQTKEQALGLLPLPVNKYAAISGARFKIKFPSPGVVLLSKGIDCSDYPPPPQMMTKVIVVQYQKWVSDVADEEDIEKHLAELIALSDAPNEI